MTGGGVSGGGDGSTQALAAKSCLHLYTYFNDRTSRIRWINPASPFQVYCDQGDGGGWMKILQYTTIYTPTSAATGTIASTTISGNAKLADSNVNYLSKEMVYKVRLNS